MPGGFEAGNPLFSEIAHFASQRPYFE